METISEDDEEYYYRAVDEKQFLCLLSVCHVVCQFEKVLFFSKLYTISDIFAQLSGGTELFFYNVCLLIHRL